MHGFNLISSEVLNNSPFNIQIVNINIPMAKPVLHFGYCIKEELKNSVIEIMKQLYLLNTKYPI